MEPRTLGEHIRKIAFPVIAGGCRRERCHRIDGMKLGTWDRAGADTHIPVILAFLGYSSGNALETLWADLLTPRKSKASLNGLGRRWEETKITARPLIRSKCAEREKPSKYPGIPRRHDEEGTEERKGRWPAADGLTLCRVLSAPPDVLCWRPRCGLRGGRANSVSRAGVDFV